MRTAVIAIGFTLALHTVCSMGLAVPSVLAPVAAPGLGLPASAVGVMVGVIYLALIPVGLTGGVLVARFGTRRLCQVTPGLTCAGLLLGAATGLAAGWLALPHLFAALLLLAAALLGSANALVNTVGAQLLFAATPARIRSLAFSIKQTAVPLGGTLAGLVLPGLLLWMPWHGATALLAVLAFAASFAILWLPIGDTRPEARAAGRISLAELAAPVRTIWSRPRLRELGLVAVIYNACQIALTAYLITYLTLEIGVSLLAAGAVFSAFQMTAVAGRVAWGISVDALGAPRRQLAIIGVLSSVSLLLIANFSSSWPLPAMIAVGVLAGASAMSWNGVFLAEAARLSRPDEVARTTGGILVFLSFGGGGGPALFALIVAVSGSYRAGFVALVALLLVMVLRLLLARPGGDR